MGFIQVRTNYSAVDLGQKRIIIFLNLADILKDAPIEATLQLNAFPPKFPGRSDF